MRKGDFTFRGTREFVQCGHDLPLWDKVRRGLSSECPYIDKNHGEDTWVHKPVYPRHVNNHRSEKLTHAKFKSARLSLAIIILNEGYAVGDS